MITIFSQDTIEFESGGRVLTDVCDIQIRRTINEDYNLEFTYLGAEPPDNEMIAYCQGQPFRIKSIELSDDGKRVYHVSAKHVFFDTQSIPVLALPDQGGTKISAVITAIFANAGPFRALSADEAGKLGMKLLEMKIDFWKIDKSMIYDVIKKLIEVCRQGEIYVDGFSFALVERIGKKQDMVLSTAKNMSDVRISYDTSEIITRLYPFGQSDLSYTGVTGNPSKAFLDCNEVNHEAMHERYGIRCGYRDYSDVIKKEELKSRAEWEFSADNPERIDVPAVHISGTFVDLSKIGLDKPVQLGDEITVEDKGIRLRQRVISMTYYPFEPTQTTLEIGRVQKNLWYYLKWMNRNSEDYNKVSNMNGDITTDYLDGSINTDANYVQSQSNRFKIEGDLMTITDSKGEERLFAGNERLFAGNEKEEKFRFQLNHSTGTTAAELTENGLILYDKNGEPVITFDSKGNGVFSGSINTEKDVKVGKVIQMYTSDSNFDQGGAIPVDHGICWIDPDEMKARKTLVAKGVVTTDNEGNMVICAGKDIKFYHSGFFNSISDISSFSIQITQLANRVTSIENTINGLKSRIQALEAKVG